MMKTRSIWENMGARKGKKMETDQWLPKKKYCEKNQKNPSQNPVSQGQVGSSEVSCGIFLILFLPHWGLNPPFFFNLTRFLSLDDVSNELRRSKPFRFHNGGRSFPANPEIGLGFFFSLFSIRRSWLTLFQPPSSIPSPAEYPRALLEGPDMVIFKSFWCPSQNVPS